MILYVASLFFTRMGSVPLLLSAEMSASEQVEAKDARKVRPEISFLLFVLCRIVGDIILVIMLYHTLLFTKRVSITLSRSFQHAVIIVDPLSTGANASHLLLERYVPGFEYAPPHKPEH